jgi:hypothetical protein
MHYTVFLYRIFLASPQDVAREREIFCKVVDWVNEQLFQLGLPARLEVLGWERYVHPDIGLPEPLILRCIPIEKCDIFVAIFWKRFGTPPGTFRTDGTPYLAGTEQEIEEAIRARRQNERNRPVIMIFLKTDGIPPHLPKEEREQLERLMKYLDKFEVGGEHPALIRRFKTRTSPSRISEEFRFMVAAFLLSTVKEFLIQDQVI